MVNKFCTSIPFPVIWVACYVHGIALALGATQYSQGSEPMLPFYQAINLNESDETPFHSIYAGIANIRVRGAAGREPDLAPEA